MRYKELFNFIQERYQIFLKKERGESKPWTKDLILQKFKFCNVHRENDTVTRWIAKHWREPHKRDPHLWFAMCVARYINWSDTLADLGYPVPWNAEHFREILYDRQIERRRQVFTGAYIIHSLGPKIPYLANRVFTPLWVSKYYLQPRRNDKLETFFTRLRECQGMGSFMAGQVIADLKYVEPLRSASDWWTWAAQGPGSTRGLNRVCGYSIDAKWKRGQWLATLNGLQTKIDPLCKGSGIPRLHAQDLQNCLCEYDKFERVRLGEGRPRSLYPGAK